MSIFDGQQKPEGQDEKGRFAKGNQLWRRALGKTGPPRIFEAPEDLEAAAIEYFEWAEDNPQYEAKGFSSGMILPMPHPIPLSIRGFCAFHGMSERTWREYRDRAEFQDMVERIEAIMVDQRYAGAAVGMFNANLIARDLGLAELTENKTDMSVEVVDRFAENSDSE